MDNSILAALLDSIQDDDIIDKKIIRSLCELLQDGKSCSHFECPRSCSDCESRERESFLSSSFNSSVSSDGSTDSLLDSTQLLEILQKQTLKLSETRIYMKELIVHLLQSGSTESLSESSVPLTNDSLYNLRQLVNALKTETEIIKSLGDSMKDHNRMQQETNNLLNKVLLLRDRATEK